MAHPITEPPELNSPFPIRKREYSLLSKLFPYWNNLDQQLVNLLIDQLILLRNLRRSTLSELTTVDVGNGFTQQAKTTVSGSNLYEDYSFVVAPMYKAFEGFLVFLAKELKLFDKGYEHRIGGLYSWKDENEQREIVVTKIKEKLENDTDLIDLWRELGTILRRYRASPAHYGGDTIYSYEEADGHVKAMFIVMHHAMRRLIQKGLLTNKDRYHAK